MHFPFYIARRYLFAKKSHNAINIITRISVFAVAAVTMALVVVLSVFNGFDHLIQSLFSTFDPELRITVNEGKVFSLDAPEIQKLYVHPAVDQVVESLEENALVKFGDQQYIGVIKGVSDNFGQVSGVDSMIAEGHFTLRDQNRPYAIIGQGLAYYLSYSINFADPVSVYIPRRTGRATMDPTRAFQRKFFHVSGVFRIEQSYDSKYLIIPIQEARGLLEYETEVSSLGLQLAPGYHVNTVQKEISGLLGSRYSVKNRYQQNEVFYKIMKTEKWAIFFILSFILLVASFNILGSLAMLILEKKADIFTLQSMGARPGDIRSIFLAEGWLISFLGVMVGLLTGVAICLAQQHFGFVSLKGSGSFIIDAYPVYVKISDLLLIFAVVNITGLFASYLPVRYLSKKYGLG